MKKLCIYLVFITLCLLVLDRLADRYLEKIYYRDFKNHSFGHLNYYLDEVDCDTLILGSSKVLHGVNPKILGHRTYNLAIEGCHFSFFSGLVHVIDSYQKLPKKVLIFHIEPYEFYSQYDFQYELNRLKFYYFTNDFIKNEIDNISSTEFLKFLFHSYRFNSYTVDLLTDSLNTVGERPLNRGYLALKPSSDNLQRINIDVKENKKNTGKKLIFNNSKAILNLIEIQKLCSKNNIELKLVTLPNYSNTKNVVAISRKLSQFCQKNKISYLNYFTRENDSLKNMDYWFDNLHLNEKGATFFSKQLKNDLIFSKI